MLDHSSYHLATAVDAEQSFSHGRILISHLRNRLRASSIRALMCFGDWCRQQLVSDTELTAALSVRGLPLRLPQAHSSTHPTVTRKSPAVLLVE